MDSYFSFSVTTVSSLLRVWMASLYWSISLFWISWRSQSRRITPSPVTHLS